MFTETTLERINADRMPEVDHMYAKTQITWKRYIKDGHRFETETVSIDVPDWIEADHFTMNHTDTVCSLRDLIRGGCASGCYMPAVTYADAIQTMASHGDDVTDYILKVYGEIPAMLDDHSHSMYCCHVLSIAVELWASAALDTLDEWD